MEQLLQALVLGLLIGGVYALMASGLTLVFGVMNIVNVAHGATLIAVAMVTWFVWHVTGLDPLLVGVLLVPVMFGGVCWVRVIFGGAWLAYGALISRTNTDSVPMWCC